MIDVRLYVHKIWSRRINLEHRLVDRVGQTQIDFLACRYHYE